MIKFLSCLNLSILLWAGFSGFAIEDTYERGNPSSPFPAVTDESSEFYRQWLEGTNFAEHHFSPGYSGGDPSPFWDRVDKQAPGPTFVLHGLWANPKHLIWDTPINMGRTVKESWFDTWRESESGGEIALDMVEGLPNTAMVGVNGIWDSGTNFYTDVWAPAIGGALVLWPTRFLSSLTKGAPGVYNVVDVIPKTLWSVALPVRKLGVTVADQTQMVTNFVYRTITHPLHIPDHVQRYWGPTERIDYAPRTYVPGNPQTTPSGTRTLSPVSRPPANRPGPVSAPSAPMSSPAPTAPPAPHTYTPPPNNPNRYTTTPETDPTW